MKDQKYTRPVYVDKDRQLFETVAHCRRFENAVVNHFIRDTDAGINKQFSAVTFDLDNHSRFIAFRGTDGSIVGWKEDFNMAFSAPIPAQQQAIEYLTLLAGEDDCELYVNRFIVFKLFQSPEIVLKCLQNIDPSKRKMVRKLR